MDRDRYWALVEETRPPGDDPELHCERLARRLLPPEFDQKRKQGFCIPLDSWLAAGPWRRFFADVLLDGARESPFERRWVRMLLDGQARGLRNGERLFGLVLFELWRREYRVSL